MTLTEYQRQRLNSPKYKEYGGVARAARELGISYDAAYLEIRLKQRGFNSWIEYERYKWESHTKKKKYRALSTMICTALQRLNKNQAWLAKAIKESKQIVSLYIQAKTFPRTKETRRKIEEALELKPNCLEEIIGN
jgi:hypothetical protein